MSSLWQAILGLFVTSAPLSLPPLSVPAAEQRTVSIALAQLTIHAASGEKLLPLHQSGQLLLLDFWAQWCGPCLEQMQSLEALQKTLGPNRIKIVLVSSQSGFSADQTYAASHGIPFPVLAYEPVDAGILGAALGAPVSGHTVEISLPTTILIGTDGTVIAVAHGRHDWSAPSVVSQLKSFSHPH